MISAFFFLFLWTWNLSHPVDFSWLVLSCCWFSQVIFLLKLKYHRLGHQQELQLALYWVEGQSSLGSGGRLLCLSRDLVEVINHYWSIGVAVVRGSNLLYHLQIWGLLHSCDLPVPMSPVNSPLDRSSLKELKNKSKCLWWISWSVWFTEVETQQQLNLQSLICFGYKISYVNRQQAYVNSSQGNLCLIVWRQKFCNNI